MNSTLYQHRQSPMLITRSLVLVPMALFLVLTAWLLISGHGMIEAIGPIIAFTILLIVDTLFASLTVTVSDETILVSFGPGLIRKELAIDEITSASVVRNRWWHGLGIRKIQNGWLYNISGLDAVELQMKNGRRYRIGTDEPKELLNAIESALSRSVMN